MIFDRKKRDIDSAINIINSKVKNFMSLSEEDLETLEKGTININTLNRIENKQAELKSLLDSHSYFVGEIITKQWGYNDIFSIDDFNRIISNIFTLKKSFFVYSNSPKDFFTTYDYENLNNLEKILFDLESMIEYMVSNYRECGTFESEGDVNG